MTEYIDREALLRDIERYNVSDGAFQHWVEIQPAADVIEVVRCEDCKHCNSFVLPTGRLMYTCMDGTHNHQMLLKPNDFCSRGERKGGGNND